MTKISKATTSKGTASKSREGRDWPRYMFWGRVRTSTVVLLVAFVGTWWLYEEYRPLTEPAPAPATQVVPPGFIPDPSYTWVPRTEVQTRTYTPTTTIEASTSVPETTGPSEPSTTPTTPTTPTTTGAAPPTTTGPTSPTTPTSPTSAPATTPGAPGVGPSTAVTTPIVPANGVPGAGPRATPAAPTQ